MANMPRATSITKDKKLLAYVIKDLHLILVTSKLDALISTSATHIMDHQDSADKVQYVQTSLDRITATARPDLRAIHSATVKISMSVTEDLVLLVSVAKIQIAPTLWELLAVHVQLA